MKSINTNKKILIIAKYFPPTCKNVGWMIRITEMANFLASEGYSVTVITVDRKTKYPDLLKVDNKVSVNCVRTLPEYFGDYQSVNYFINGMFRLLKYLLFRYRKILGLLLGIKTGEDINIYKKAINVINIEKIQNVIITAPPYGVINLGNKLKEKYKNEINVIIDYRDPWMVHPKRNLRKQPIEELTTEDKHQFERAYLIEKTAINTLDSFLFVNDQCKELYDKEFGPKNYLTVENGYLARYIHSAFENHFKELALKYKAQGYLIIGYFGNAIGKGLKSHFLDFIQGFYSEEKIVLFIQGPHKRDDYLQYSFNVELFNQTDYGQAISNMKQVDVCYLPLMGYFKVGAKFYDYVASGSPIWICGKKDFGYLHDFSIKNKRVFFSEQNKESIKNTLDLIISLKKNGELGKHGFNSTEIYQFSRDYQFNKVKKVLY